MWYCKGLIWASIKMPKYGVGTSILLRTVLPIPSRVRFLVSCCGCDWPGLLGAMLMFMLVLGSGSNGCGSWGCSMCSMYVYGVSGWMIWRSLLSAWLSLRYQNGLVMRSRLTCYCMYFVHILSLRFHLQRLFVGIQLYKFCDRSRFDECQSHWILSSGWVDETW